MDDPVDAAAAGWQSGTDDACEIFELYYLAGRENEAASFIRDDANPRRVRERLFKDKTRMMTGQAPGAKPERALPAHLDAFALREMPVR